MYESLLYATVTSSLSMRRGTARDDHAQFATIRSPRLSRGRTAPSTQIASGELLTAWTVSLYTSAVERELGIANEDTGMPGPDNEQFLQEANEYVLLVSRLNRTWSGPGG